MPESSGTNGWARKQPSKLNWFQNVNIQTHARMSWVMIFVFQIIATKKNYKPASSSSHRHQHQLMFQFFISFALFFHILHCHRRRTHCSRFILYFGFGYASLKMYLQFCSPYIFNIWFFFLFPKKTKTFSVASGRVQTVTHSSWVKFFSSLLFASFSS